MGNKNGSSNNIDELMRKNGGVKQRGDNLWRFAGGIKNELTTELKKFGKRIVKVSQTTSDSVYILKKNVNLWLYIISVLIALIFVSTFLF
jgi:hypothetical protein